MSPTKDSEGATPPSDALLAALATIIATDGLAGLMRAASAACKAKALRTEAAGGDSRPWRDRDRFLRGVAVQAERHDEMVTRRLPPLG